MPETNIAVIEKPVLLLEVETPQTVALQKENVVELELQRIEKAYKGLRVTGLDDVQGINLVSDARKYCKKVRTTTKRICEAGRADALAEQQRWLQTEKYVVERVRKIEDELIAEENRIAALKEEARQEEARKLKVENERLNSLCLRFAVYGKYCTQDELRELPAEKIAQMLADAEALKAEKDADAKRKAEAREAETKKLREEKKVADEQAEAMRRRIAELEAQLRPTVPMPEPVPIQEPEHEPQGFAGRRQQREAQCDAMAAADKAHTPALPKLPPLPATAQGAVKNAAMVMPAPFRLDEATMIRQDKTALITFAQQVAILKKYLPVVHSEKATGLNELIADQIEKFAAFVTKRAEAL